ncbi:pectin lyase-like protein [Thozetella sp. PMI_491]|nr:pectin lyase-like protein [Thozetella sp. PMI_491]
MEKAFATSHHSFFRFYSGQVFLFNRSERPSPSFHTATRGFVLAHWLSPSLDTTVPISLLFPSYQYQVNMKLSIAAVSTLALGATAFPNPLGDVFGRATTTKKTTAAAATSTKASTKTSTAKSAAVTTKSTVVAAASGLPASSGSSTFSSPKTIAAGESFDGGMVMYDRGVSCTGQAEGGDSDAVFQIEEGGSLSNVIIGPNQIEGVHCQGACTLTNVWWSAVCEDAFTVKNQDAGATTYIKGGGAFGAEDKVVQHNGAGTINISGFTVDDFGKLYRSCGNCDSMFERHVVMDSITASSGKILAGTSPLCSRPVGWAFA